MLNLGMSRTRKTGTDWAKIIGITIVNPKGWLNEKQYSQELISKTEFLNRAAASEVSVGGDLSRRAAAKLFKTI